MRLKRDTLCSFVSDFLLQLWTLCFLDEASSVIEVRTTMTEYFHEIKCLEHGESVALVIDVLSDQW